MITREEIQGRISIFFTQIQSGYSRAAVTTILINDIEKWIEDSNKKIEKDCNNCKYRNVNRYIPPCNNCKGCGGYLYNWEKEDKEENL